MEETGYTTASVTKHHESLPDLLTPELLADRTGWAPRNPDRFYGKLLYSPLMRPSSCAVDDYSDDLSPVEDHPQCIELIPTD